MKLGERCTWDSCRRRRIVHWLPIKRRHHWCPKDLHDAFDALMTVLEMP